MVGNEGMTGLSIVLGDDRSTNEAQVQSSGTALRIAAEALRDLMAASRSLTADLLRYVNVFMVQEARRRWPTAGEGSISGSSAGS
jgi:hypothetical protein